MDTIKQLYKPPKKYQNSYIATNPREEYQADIMYMPNQYKKNDDYVLCVIDVGTKIADARILKNKTSKETLESMKEIISYMGKPQQIYCDSGGEFNSKEFKHWATVNNIKMIYTTRHAPFVERFNQTIKRMLYMHMEEFGYKTWGKELLSRMIRNYNNRFHRSIKMKPLEASKNWTKAHENIQLNALPVKYKNLYNIGDKVRILNKTAYKHSYLPNWSKRVYTINDKQNGEYILNNGKSYHYNDILLIDQSPQARNITEPDLEDEHSKIVKEKKRHQIFRREDIKEENIINQPRIRKKKEILNL